jgi:hypothetical protein
MQDTDQIREKYWQGHISSWKKSSVGIREYCQKNGISKDTFYYWRKRIGASTIKRSRLQVSPQSLFAPVAVERAEFLSSLPTSDHFQDPKWLGEFAAALIRGLR